jgi:hypothetical protein
MQTKILRQLEKIIVSYIPKNSTCRIEEAKREFKRTKEKAELANLVNEKINFSNPLEIDIKTIWEKQSPNMSLCSSCFETIYSKQYLLSIKFNGELLQQQKPKILCEYCYVNNVLND